MNNGLNPIDDIDRSLEIENMANEIKLSNISKSSIRHI